jgi:formate hydrogenlyase subunit 6/NADH:ubiquinone oxidoreductase subunit I
MKIPGKMAKEVLEHSVMKPATCNYPAEKRRMPEHFRGRIRYKAENCIGCKICMRDCPARAIEIIKKADKVFEAKFHLDRCIYCGQCVDSCPKDALELTPEFELAQVDKEKLTVVCQREEREDKPENKSEEPS